MKHILLSLASLMVCAPIGAQSFSGGSGMASDPWLISSHADLDALNNLTNQDQTAGRYFLLINDITEPYTNLIATEEPFRGHFDGGGHCINVNIHYPGESYLGLFCWAMGATISNLQVEGSVLGLSSVGAIIGQAANGTRLENLVNYADVRGNSTSLLANVGGVVGNVMSQTAYKDSCQVINCANYGTVYCEGSCVGGVIGYSGQQRGNLIRRVVNYGHVVAPAERTASVIGNPLWNDNVAGIVSLGTIEHNTTSACMGNSNPEQQSEMIYDGQYCPTIYEYPMQMKFTQELLGDGMKSTSADSQLSDRYWVFEDDMLPRLKMNGQEYSPRAILYATPLVLDIGNDLSNISSPFRVGISHGVSWSTLNGHIAFDTLGNAYPLQTGSETIIAQLDGYTREINVNVTNTTVYDGISRLSTTDTPTPVYDISGRRVCRDSSISTLPSCLKHGIYIVNNKKIIK